MSPISSIVLSDLSIIQARHTALIPQTFVHNTNAGTEHDPPSPTLFRDVSNGPRWAAAIDSENSALLSRKTWKYTPKCPF